MYYFFVFVSRIPPLFTLFPLFMEGYSVYVFLLLNAMIWAFLHGMMEISCGLLYRWLIMVKPGGCSRRSEGFAMNQPR